MVFFPFENKVDTKQSFLNSLLDINFVYNAFHSIVEIKALLHSHGVFFSQQ